MSSPRQMRYEAFRRRVFDIVMALGGSASATNVALQLDAPNHLPSLATLYAALRYLERDGHLTCNYRQVACGHYPKLIWTYTGKGLA